jgi:hypothetical protein
MGKDDEVKEEDKQAPEEYRDPKYVNNDKQTAAAEQHEHVPLSTVKQINPTFTSSATSSTSSILVFSGRGSYDKNQNLIQRRRKQREGGRHCSNPFDVIHNDEKDRFAYTEQSLLEELRRYLKDLPSKREVEVVKEEEEEELFHDNDDNDEDTYSKDAAVPESTLLLLKELSDAVLHGTYLDANAR